MSRVWWLAGAVWLAGCGGGGTAPGTETAYDFAFPDPAADTVAATANPDSAKAIDLLSVSGRIDADNLAITLEFADPVTRWSDGKIDGLDGFIDFDVDENSSTGVPDNGHGLGIDAYIDLRDDGSGRVGLVNLSTGKIELLSGTWNGTTFSLTIPRPLLARLTDTDDKMFLAVDVTARRRAPNSDASPNSGHLVLEPPAAP